MVPCNLPLDSVDEYHPRFPMLSVGGDALTLLVLILSGLKAQLVQQVGFRSANLVFFLT